MKLLKLDPEEVLTFVQSSAASSTSSRILRLANPSSTDSVAYKVKTTAPKAYLVRPSAGLLKPKQEQEIQIILQPGGSETKPNTHRFLVQSVTAHKGQEALSRDDWASYPKEEVQEQRLSVAIETRDGPGGQAAGATLAGLQTVSGSNSEAGGQNMTLKAKFNELYDWTAMLEKDIKKLQAEREELRGCKRKGGKGNNSGGISNFTLMIAVFLAIFASWLAQNFS